MAIRPSAPVRKLMILEEGVLASMANNTTFVSEFPVLKSLVTLVPRASQGCSGCSGRRANSHQSEAFSRVKMALAGMADDRRQRLKQLLNAKQVRVTYKQGSRIIQHTF